MTFAPVGLKINSGAAAGAQTDAAKERNMGFATKELRNVAIVGHGGTGKTTLLEQMLFNADVIAKAESVESGKTMSDFTEEEINHRFSIYTSFTHLMWNRHKMNFLDTPGAAGFVGEVIVGLRACESALVVIDAKSGVQIETLKLWRRLNQREKPRAVFINKMDIDNADYFAVIEDLRTKFKKNFVPVTIPIGSGKDFKGIVNLIEEKAYLVHDPSKKDVASPVPEEMKDLVAEMREQMIELAAEGADDLIEKYFNEGTLSEDDIRKGLKLGIRSTRVVPVMCGSAALNNGIASFLNFLEIVAPSPDAVGEKGVDGEGQKVDLTISSDAPVSLMVIKTKFDKFAGKLSYIKMMSGVIHPDAELIDLNTGAKIKVGKLYNVQGKKLIEMDLLSAGAIGALSKIDGIATNHTLAEAGFPYRYHNLRLPHPTYSVAVTTKDKKDEDKLNEFLQKAGQQDLTFTMRYNAETKETVISAMDEMHLNMILENALDKNKIAYETKIPKIAYREAITKPCEAEYTHKKQSGGHGQYARVVMRFEPLERGMNFEFVNEIKGGAVGKNYMPGIEKGLLEAMERGFLAGYPIVDLKATIYDGKEHPVDSSEMAFKLAARGCLREAMKNGAAVMLEPIMLMHVFADEAYIGDILSNLSSKRARIQGQESIGGGITQIDAEVPQSEIQRYAIELKALTSGTGSYEIDFSHYSPISGKQAETVIEEGRSRMSADEEES